MSTHSSDYNNGHDPNSGHGHVYKRPDGVKARCGGPPLCSECARDMAALQASYRPQQPVAQVTSNSSNDEALIKALRDNAWEYQIPGELILQAANRIEQLAGNKSPSNETLEQRCGWFGEGRGQCLLSAGHEAHLQTRHHTCEQDGRLLDVALTGLAAVREAERRSEKAGEQP